MDDRHWNELVAEAMASNAAPRRICELCVAMLGVSGAGISMVTRAGNRGVVCATDPASERVEDLQFTLGKGPCVDASRDGMALLLPDLRALSRADKGRWPAFLDGADEAGVRSVFALPMRIGASSVGVLDLYRSRPGELRDDQLSAALHAADAAAVAVLQMHSAFGGVFEDDVPARGSYRLQVHQASGMTAAQLNVDVGDAFLLLRARAYSDGRPVADLAEDVVLGRIRLTLGER